MLGYPVRGWLQTAQRQDEHTDTLTVQPKNAEWKKHYLVRAIVKYGQYECVHDSLIYCSHVACVVFVWPMLIRPYGYNNDRSKHQLHKHTHIILRYLEGLVNVARRAFLWVWEWKCFLSSSSLIIQFKLQIEHSNKVNIVRKVAGSAVHCAWCCCYPSKITLHMEAACVQWSLEKGVGAWDLEAHRWKSMTLLNSTGLILCSGTSAQRLSKNREVIVITHWRSISSS